MYRALKPQNGRARLTKISRLIFLVRSVLVIKSIVNKKGTTLRGTLFGNNVMRILFLPLLPLPNRLIKFSYITITKLIPKFVQISDL